MSDNRSKERKVGETFIYKGKRVKVRKCPTIEYGVCFKCACFDIGNFCLPCLDMERKDNTEVFYEVVNNIIF